ncbi:MAG: hypothetical protein JKY09_00345 [Crocinitomicaceae bacterium]|nr:hypothetical protein [Crocinitomicaceae bacterium]
MDNKPFFLAYFGRQHSGKTYDLQQFVAKCNRKTIFVYNSGRDEDWQGYEEIELWSSKKEEILYFTYKGKDYVFATHYMKKFRGKKVKAMEADEVLTETLLYKQLKVKGRYSGLFFIIDDATNILTSRLTKAQKSCFYRAKHVNVWFCLIFHDPNMFPNGAWNALTMAKFFKNNVAPPKQKSDKIPHFLKLKQAYYKLQKAPDYSYCTLVMNTGKLSYTPYKKPVKKRIKKQTLKPKKQ